MDKENTIKIVVDNQICYGCGACNPICPFHAISMHYSTVGRILPAIDNNACRDCGLCLKVCPGIDKGGMVAPSDNGNNVLMGNILSAYCGRSLDDDIYLNAQSGGLVTAVLAYLFETEKIDAALVVGQSNLKANCYLAKSISDLKNSQLSQYTPVDLVSGLSLTKEYGSVAVVGLPCHIEGIRSVQKNFPQRFNNIKYLLGLICAGTLSQSIVDVVEKKAEHELKSIVWRSKFYPNYQNANIAAYKEDGEPIVIDRYLRLCSKPFLTAPRCKLCYDKMNVHADLVFGDSWGIKKNSEDDESVVICRSETGLCVIEEMLEKKKLRLNRCGIDEVARGQGMSKKQKTVENAIAIYKKHDWQLPSWADGFNKNNVVEPGLEKEIESYVQLDNQSREAVLDKIYGKIMMDYYVALIKNKCFKLAYKVYKIIKRK